MTHIQLGLTLPGGPRDNIAREPFLNAVQKSLDLVAEHFDSAWFTDHLQFGASPVLEGWTALTYLAAQNPRLRFGHAVLAQSFRNPALLAKMAATFQYMSSGRLILGLGAGWHEEEYKAYGYDFPAAGTRVAELEETLQIIKALWRDKQATVEGKHYRVVAAYCEPKPDPLPTIMIGGGQPRMLRLIARHADWWNVSMTPIERYREQVQECERACADVGRDPATLRRSWFGGCVCVPHGTDATKISSGRWNGSNAFIGTQDQVIEQMLPFIELGVDYFMLNNGSFPDLTTLELLIHEVLPRLNAGSDIFTPQNPC